MGSNAVRYDVKLGEWNIVATRRTFEKAKRAAGKAIIKHGFGQGVTIEKYHIEGAPNSYIVWRYDPNAEGIFSMNEQQSLAEVARQNARWERK